MNWTGSVLSLTVSLILSFKLKSHNRKVFVDHSYDKIALVLIHFISVFIQTVRLFLLQDYMKDLLSGESFERERYQVYPSVLTTP